MRWSSMYVCKKYQCDVKELYGEFSLASNEKPLIEEQNQRNPNGDKHKQAFEA